MSEFWALHQNFDKPEFWEKRQNFEKNSRILRKSAELQEKCNNSETNARILRKQEHSEEDVKILRLRLVALNLLHRI